MSRKRLHELFGLGDPEKEPGQGPDPQLINAAFRYRLATGSVDSAFFEAQSPKEREALESAGRRWLNVLKGEEHDDEPTTSPAPVQDPARAELRAKGQRLVVASLRQLEEFSDLTAERLTALLTHAGRPTLLDAVAQGDLTADEAATRFAPPLRKVVELDRARARLAGEKPKRRPARSAG